MNSKLAGEILDCLSSERRVFPYFKHRYALVLLALAAGRERTLSLAEVRRTALAPLLRKPILRAVKARDTVPVMELDAALSDAVELEHYVVTLDQWGHPRGRSKRYYQMSRRGLNLVLQLNFSSAHDATYRRLIRPEDDESESHPFEYRRHPIHKAGRRTLAWVRLDVDLDEGEALIEEVQNDWLRNARYVHEEAQSHRRCGARCGHWFFRDTRRRFEDLDRYVTSVLEVHRRAWHEAVLSAAIDFLVREVGIREIYWHTWEGGRALKGMTRDNPPVWLYEKLPVQFCFERVASAPRFLAHERGSRFRRRVREAAEEHGFWRLAVPTLAPASLAAPLAGNSVCC